MKAPKGHKKSCGCPFCKAYRAQVKKRTRKAAATSKRKRNPVSKPKPKTVECRNCERKTSDGFPGQLCARCWDGRRPNPTTGTVGKWITAKAIRVRKVAGKLLVDVKR